jgi:phage terminase large subunit
MEIKLDKKIFNEAFYPHLFDYSKRWNVYKGSAGSGKSHFISQKLIIKILNDPGRRILVCRRYGSSITNTVWQQMITQLRFFKILDMCEINKTDRTITLPNGSMIIFMGLDIEEKLLSLTDISDIWIEEAFEITQDMAQQLSFRMRGQKPNQQLYLSFNPISKSSWLYEFCEGSTRPKSFFYHQSTYRDNRFLTKDYIEELEDTYRTNPQKARIYCDGNWGVVTESLVFPNHKVENFDIDEKIADKSLAVKIGCDLGYVDASTVVISLWDKANKKIFVISEYYETRATLDDVVEGMKSMGVGKLPVFVDSAEPRSIAYFNQLGINAQPSKKSNGANALYISFLQNHEIIIHESCSHVAEDFENFCYLKNRQTGQLDETKFDHAYSHTIDALKYSYSDVYKNKKLKSFNWKLGI